MTTPGVDYSFSRPGGAALAAAGIKFAMRYLPYPGDGGKGLTAAERDDLRHNGIAVGAIWETYAGRARSGKSAGVVDGTAAKSALAALGFPTSCPAYFAVDFDMQRTDEAAVADYFAGVRSVLGFDRTGLYGGLSAVQHGQNGGWARFFWQTYAWSLGIWAPGVHLQQYSNGHAINGASVDYDRALVDDYGQWPGEAVLIYVQKFDPARTVTIPAGTKALAGYALHADGSLSVSVAAQDWPSGSTMPAAARYTVGSADYLLIADGLYAPGGSRSLVPAAGLTVSPDPVITGLQADLKAAQDALKAAQANAAGVKTATAALNTAVAKL